MYCSKIPTVITTIQDMTVRKKKYIISKYCNCKALVTNSRYFKKVSVINQNSYLRNSGC